jgi:hypothetical protein
MAHASLAVFSAPTCAIGALLAARAVTPRAALTEQNDRFEPLAGQQDCQAQLEAYRGHHLGQSRPILAAISEPAELCLHLLATGCTAEPPAAPYTSQQRPASGGLND